MADDRVIRDPVYGYVAVDSELIGIIDHRLFQRLRRISQTSLTSYVYPSATGSRFEHALGAMHLADRAWSAIWARRSSDSAQARKRLKEAVRHDIPTMSSDGETFGEQLGLAFQASALLHDVGHTPFSHALEDVYRTTIWQPDPESRSGSEEEVVEGLLNFHEFAGRQIARLICDDVFTDQDSPFVKAGGPEAIRMILDPRPSGWTRTLHQAIAGEIDIDRIDYLMRDSHKAAGSEFGSIDYQRLLDALELRVEDSEDGAARFMIAPWLRARSAVETLLIQRRQSYEYIHFHTRSVGFNLALRRAVQLVIELGRLAEEDGRAPISTLLRANFPNLIYWDPEKVDPGAALGLWSQPRQADDDEQISILEVPIDSDQFESKLLGSRQLTQAALADVDDSTVLEMLKRARLLVESAPPRYLTPETEEKARQLEIYSRAALSRRKNFAPAWKSVDEYVDAAEEMTTSLLEAVPRRLRERAATASESAADSMQAIADRIEAAFVPPSQQSPDGRIAAVISLNTIADLLLVRPGFQDAIRDGLNRKPEVGDTRGVWDLAYTGGGPVEQLAVDLHSRSGQVSMSDRSPLAQAVWLAEEQRMKLAVYFFFESRDFSDPSEGSMSNLRGRVHNEAVARLPNLILEAIDDYV